MGIDPQLIQCLCNVDVPNLVTNLNRTRVFECCSTRSCVDARIDIRKKDSCYKMIGPFITVFVNLGFFRHFETITNIRTWIKSHGYWRML